MLELVAEHNISKVCAVVDGGKIAQESIYNALKKAESENPTDTVVLIHDGVRPILPSGVISANIECARKKGNAITSIAAFETTVISYDGKTVNSVPYRKNIYIAQAPQTFRLCEIIEAHEQLQKTEQGYEDMVDSCTIFKFLNKPTHLVKGNFGNIKITTMEDVYVLKGLLQIEGAKNG
jgi:2-C-methyl-D-erythritol 4-phosphate cytidylyltransferase